METLLPLAAPVAQGTSPLSLCTAFRELSTWTWAMLATAADAGLPLQEETITDVLLLQLAARCPRSIKVIPFAKRQEAKVGADWEWWFCDWPDGVGFRVQAKRIFPDRWYFNSLKFPVRGPSQTDVLIEEAREGVVQLYCFYVSEQEASFTGTLTRSVARLPTHARRHRREDQKQARKEADAGVGAVA